MHKLPAFFSLKKQYNFVLDIDVLNSYYLPIIGEQGLSLYKLLYNLPHAEFALADFLAQNNISGDEFEVSRKKLESVDLLHTFLEKDTCNYFFSIHPAKSINEIETDVEFLNLLKHFSPIQEIEKKKHIFGTHKLNLDNLTEISETKTYLINEKPIYRVDFNSISQNLTSYFKTLVVITDECKQIIDIYSPKIPYDKIIEILTQSCESKNGVTYVSYNTLLVRINNYINIISRSVAKNVKLIRDSQLFTTNAISKYKMEQIFACYQTHTSEEYLRGILHSDLAIEDLAFINETHKKISHELLNMVLDMYYSCKLVTRGWKKYISKVVDTINQKGIDSLQALLNYFNGNTAKLIKEHNTSTRNIFASHEPNEQKTNAEIVEW